MRYIRPLFWLLVGVGLFLFLQMQYAFHFYYIEQNQLFLLDGAFLAGRLMQPGGLSMLLSGFLVQFFYLPYMGAALTAGLFVLTGLAVYALLRRVSPGVDSLFLSLVPGVCLLFIQFQFNYSYSGSVAYLLALVALWAISFIGKDTVRLAGHLVLVPVLFLLGGSVYVLYALSALVYEGMKRPSHKYIALVVLVEAILIGMVCLYLSVRGEYRFVFLPDWYYHQRIVPPPVIYASWVAFPLLLLLAFFVRKKELPGKKQYLSLLAQGVAVLALCVWGVPRYDDAKSYRAKELDYYARNGEWDKILERSEGPLKNYLYLYYANLALLGKGELADRLFSYDQHGPSGLLLPWNKTNSISVMLSDFYWEAGYTAIAQEMAFEAYVATEDNGSPRMLKRLIQTNLVIGAYPVAGKYIRLLEHTMFYREWAASQRVFLHNDTAVEADPVLGGKRRSLPHPNNLSQIDGLEQALCKIAEANPASPSAIEVVGAAHLLTKDILSFKQFIEKYYATEALPELPKSFQEALFIFSEAEPEYRNRFNLSEAVERRFNEFKKQVLAGGNNKNALPGLLKRSFGDTYWYYYMFKTIEP